MRSAGKTFGMVITMLLLAAVLGSGVLIGLVVHGSSNRPAEVAARADMPATVTAIVRSATGGQAMQEAQSSAVPPTLTTVPAVIIGAPLSTPTAASQPQIVITTGFTPTACPAFQGEEVIGTWRYQGSRPAFPPPASQCQVLMAQGDITDSATCHYHLFEQGQQIGNLGSGTFVLLRFTGPRDQIDARIQSIAADLARANATKGGCPRI
jgi:hypothetical protein